MLFLQTVCVTSRPRSTLADVSGIITVASLCKQLLFPDHLTSASSLQLQFFFFLVVVCLYYARLGMILDALGRVVQIADRLDGLLCKIPIRSPAAV